MSSGVPRGRGGVLPRAALWGGGKKGKKEKENKKKRKKGKKEKREKKKILKQYVITVKLKWNI